MASSPPIRIWKPEGLVTLKKFKEKTKPMKKGNRRGVFGQEKGKND